MSIFEQQILRLPKPNYEYITTEEDAKRAMNEIAQHPIIEVDSETTGLDPYTAKMVLMQIGIPGKSYVFDVRHDTDFSDIHPNLLNPILTGPNQLRILQNAVFDMKMYKIHGGVYIDNVYDTMLIEILLTLGLYPLGAMYKRAGLAATVKRYFGITMDKEPRNTFSDYGQELQPFQLEYAANDVTILGMMRDVQLPQITKHGLETAAALEFRFTKPMCEMELNGITFDVEKHRCLLEDIEDDKNTYAKEVGDILSEIHDQTTLFGVSMVNIDSNVQLLKTLKKYGLDLENTQVGTLEKHKGLPVIDALLAYRKAQKFVSTYGESLIAKIHALTGRLHTGFNQMVSTGRMSSFNPNLQNIPKKQKYRSCFVSKEGYVLITADMSGAELRILGNMSQDPVFIESYKKGIDIHTSTAAAIFNIPMSQVKSAHRNGAKAINFGLAYGLSKVGLAKRLKITENEAEKMMNKYFQRYQGIKKFLDKSARDAVRNLYSRSITGRKRFYTLPHYDHPDYKQVKGSIERRAKNAPIQGSNADTIKESMCLVVNRLEQSGYDAKLLLTVHDEVVVETPYEQRREVSEIIEKSLIDGFGKYFSLIPMKTDALVGPCWLKDACEDESSGQECGGTEMEFIDDKKYGTKLICKKCGSDM